MQRADERVAGLAGGGRAADGGDEGADGRAVEGQVEGDPAHVVALQLGGQVAEARGLVSGADPDVVDVHLVLDGHEVDRAEQLVELHERVVQLLDGLVEGVVVRGVQPGHAQEAGQEVGQPLAELAHLVGERPVLPDARAAQGPGQLLLRPLEVVRRDGQGRLTHSGLPGR